MSLVHENDALGISQDSTEEEMGRCSILSGRHHSIAISKYVPTIEPRN